MKTSLTREKIERVLDLPPELSSDEREEILADCQEIFDKISEQDEDSL